MSIYLLALGRGGRGSSLCGNLPSGGPLGSLKDAIGNNQQKRNTPKTSSSIVRQRSFHLQHTRTECYARNSTTARHTASITTAYSPWILPMSPTPERVDLHSRHEIRERRRGRENGRRGGSGLGGAMVVPAATGSDESVLGEGPIRLVILNSFPNTFLHTMKTTILFHGK